MVIPALEPPPVLETRTGTAIATGTGFQYWYRRHAGARQHHAGVDSSSDGRRSSPLSSSARSHGTNGEDGRSSECRRNPNVGFSKQDTRDNVNRTNPLRIPDSV